MVHEAPRRPREIEYPERDGKPMAEDDLHREEMNDYVLHVLDDHYAGDPMVYVSSNNFVYDREGDPKACVSPDGYVVRGVAKHRRRAFKVWAEGGRRPCVVFEITSKSTRREDREDKKRKYEQDLEVPEYFLFDPFGEWIPERLRGFRLEGGKYVALTPAQGRLRSEQLGLDLAEIDGHLRFIEAQSGRVLPTRVERADQERQRADQERQRAEDAERELECLRAELAKLR